MSRCSRDEIFIEGTEFEERLIGCSKDISFCGLSIGWLGQGLNASHSELNLFAVIFAARDQFVPIGMQFPIFFVVHVNSHNSECISLGLAPPDQGTVGFMFMLDDLDDVKPDVIVVPKVVNKVLLCLLLERPSNLLVLRNIDKNVAHKVILGRINQTLTNPLSDGLTALPFFDLDGDPEVVDLNNEVGSVLHTEEEEIVNRGVFVALPKQRFFCLSLNRFLGLARREQSMNILQFDDKGLVHILFDPISNNFLNSSIALL